MGFFDTIAGAGRAILGGVVDILETPAGQQFVAAGAQALTQSIFPGQQRTQFVNPLFQQQQALFGGAVPQQFQQFQRFPSQFGFPPVQGLPFSTSSIPPGAGIMPAFPISTSQFGGIGAGFVPAAFDLPFIDIVPQGGGAQLGSLTSPFVPTMAGARAQAFVSPNPMTGKLTWFKPAGKPILWSGDLTACRRVSRIARRAKRLR